MKRRTGADRVKAINVKAAARQPIVIDLAGAGEVDPDVLSFLDGLLAEGRALVRSKASA